MGEGSYFKERVPKIIWGGEAERVVGITFLRGGYNTLPPLLMPMYGILCYIMSHINSSKIRAVENKYILFFQNRCIHS
jgi:hypothetical protein